MSFSVSLDTSKLDSIIARIPGEYRDRIVKETAFHILGEARKRAPVATGALRNNSEVVNGIGYTNVEFKQEYAAYVELGTHNADGSVRMAERPYLKPAVEAEAKLLEDRLRKGFPK